MLDTVKTKAIVLNLELDPILIALAGCPVIAQKETGGHIVFNPYPVISASNSLILAHEICHKLAGRAAYNKFVTSCNVRNDEIFQFILNLLVDWFDEYHQSHYSIYLANRIRDLKTTVEINPDWPQVLQTLFVRYKNNLSPVDYKLYCTEDLIVEADKLTGRLIEQVQNNLMLFTDLFGSKGKWVTGLDLIKVMINDINKAKKDRGIGASSDLMPDPRVGSTFYLNTVSKYNSIIDTVCTLWTRNRYCWRKAYFGEIDWKNLPNLMLGDKLGQDIYKLFSKLDINRNVYLVIDRSGSTSSITNPIMETAIIIAESFRRCKVPISILDVGHTNSLINDINEPLDIEWFTPLSSGGTPLGKVISLIKDSHPEDYLLIVTDGEPDCWETRDYPKQVGLKDAITGFKGYHLTFVIGGSFKTYFQQLNGHAVSVEPTTIVRELINDSTLSS